MNIVMIHRGAVVLQNYVEIPKVESTSCSETRESSFDHGNEAIDIKVEVTDLQEEDPLLLTLPIVCAEHEVSCVGLNVGCLYILQISSISYCINYIHMSFHMTPHSGNRILNAEPLSKCLLFCGSLFM
jgi:hypothetical protein